MTLQPSNEPSTPLINVYNNVVYLPPLCAMAVTHTEALDISEMAVYSECAHCVLAIRRVYTLNACATCNGTGGDVEGDMQGDEHMTAYVEWFIPCVDCIERGLCPNCGVATLTAENIADIATFTCIVCDWHYEAPGYDDSGDYDDAEPYGSYADDFYEGPPGSGLGYA